MFGLESKIKAMRFIMIRYELVIKLTIDPNFHLFTEFLLSAFVSICSV